MNATSRCDLPPDRLGKLYQPVAVDDRMHRIEPQAVEAIFFQPIKRILYEEASDDRVAKIDRSTPGRMRLLLKEARGVSIEIVTFWSEVVVDHVLNHHQAQVMGVVDQRLQLVRCPIGGVGG